MVPLWLFSRSAGRPGEGLNVVTTDAARVLLTGGSGLIGGRLASALRRSGQPLRLLTRHPRRIKAEADLEPVGWDGLHFESRSLAGCRAIIHLAGEPIFGGLPSAARRERMRTSRVSSTASLVDTLETMPEKDRPSVLLCGSAVGYYGSRGEESLDEDAPPGQGFLAELCRSWEQEAARAAPLGLRVVSMRIGVVLAREGGALPRMLPPFRLGLGGALGGGNQWFPWVHIDDLVALFLWALETDTVSGPINAVAPGAIRNRDFTSTLAGILRRPAWLRVPAFALRAALGEISGELLGSRRVIPARAIALGFEFQHESVESALREALD
jgi:uncharacterized protein (TIGR01777 family)